MHRANRQAEAVPPRENRLLATLEGLGRTVAELGHDVAAFVNMLGALAQATTAMLRRPQTFRLTSAVHHLDRVGWQAVPIVVLITFLIGGIIAQQGFFHFRKFGADAYVVDMVGILVLREIGVLIVAIMVAGRSGSSYTAELGSMKMREEIDALRTMGLDPVGVLILPRVLALVLALPLLTFLGAMAALYGGGLVAWLYGDFHCPLEGSDFRHPFQGRHDQGAVHGAGDRRRGLLGGAAGQGQRRIARTADHHLGRQIDLPGDRARRPVRHLLRRDRNVSAGMETLPDTLAIRVRDLVVSFGDHVVLDHLALDVRRGEILGFVGGSGSGKSVLLRTIIGLLPKRQGTIEVLGVDLDAASETQLHAVQRRWGVLFQQGALFSSLTALQNVQFPMREYLQLSDRLLAEIALAKLEMVGLDADDGDKFPAELSGGMTKRVALARALALDPEIVFLDEPTSGLDPIAAGDFDELIGTLQRTLGLTVFMVTHDLDSLSTVCDRVAALADGRVIAVGPVSALAQSAHPWMRAYFQGRRGRAPVRGPTPTATRTS
jgi:phospholipid/cholesterol/gamma-HCH transport system ATP-binding protein